MSVAASSRRAGTTRGPGEGANRTVSKLRPKKPMFVKVTDSVLDVAKFLSSKRTDACLVADDEGALAGIFTDKDLTRRVISKGSDPASVTIEEVMTQNPTSVAMDDPAMEALQVMIEGRFRHLPVTDPSTGAISGLLDIAKCLHDAIGRLERAAEKAKLGVKGGAAEDAIRQVASLQQSAAASGDSQKAAMLQQMLLPLLQKALENKSGGGGAVASPTLRSVLGKTTPTTIVSPDTSTQDVAAIMASARKAALIVDDDSGELIGIFGFKDMMNRVVAKELPLEYTAVSEVMTPNPETVSGDMTVLEALQVMHDNRFLTLPVTENGERTDSILGVVDVVDLVYGSGGSEGWRSIFGSALDLADDKSDTMSMSSFPQSVRTGTESAAQQPVVRARNARSAIAQARGTGRPTASFADGENDSQMGLDEAVFKVVHGSKTHRVRCELRIDRLYDSIEERIGRSREKFSVEFTDDEGDKILIMTDDDLAEAVAIAHRTGVSQTVKLVVVESDALRRILGGASGGGGRGGGGGDDNTIILLAAAGAALLTVIVVLMATNRRPTYVPRRGYY